MASIFKRARDRQRRGAAWYIAYTDGENQRRTVRGCTDKIATEAMARKLESEAALIRSGVVDTRAEAYRLEARRPVGEHLADWHANLIGKGNTRAHADLNRTHVARIVALVRGADVAEISPHNAAKTARRRSEAIVAEHLAAARLTDLTPDRVQIALARLRDDGRSLQTLTAYVRAAKGFSRWLWRAAGRIPADTLAPLAGFNVATDRRHDRRELSREESGRLIQAAERGPVVEGMTGPNRAMLYRLALGTGFRANELRTLTADCFDLDADPPVVVVAAAYSKHRRRDVQPIPVTLAAALRPWLAARPHLGPVFDGMTKRTAKMMRGDLEAARIAYRDASGRVADFHALRATYISSVVRGGASVKTAQSLARHSSPVLTIGRYSHVAIHDQTAALQSLPELPPIAVPEALPICATGTDPVTPGCQEATAPCQRARTGKGRGGSGPVGMGRKTVVAQRETRAGVVRLGSGTVGEAAPGFEPGNDGFANRSRISVTSRSVKVFRRPAPPVTAPCQRAAPDMAPDLAAVVEAWERLPEAVRSAVLTLVQAAATTAKP